MRKYKVMDSKYTLVKNMMCSKLDALGPMLHVDGWQADAETCCVSKYACKHLKNKEGIPVFGWKEGDPGHACVPINNNEVTAGLRAW